MPNGNCYRQKIIDEQIISGSNSLTTDFLSVGDTTGNLTLVLIMSGTGYSIDADYYRAFNYDSYAKVETLPQSILSSETSQFKVINIPFPTFTPEIKIKLSNTGIGDVTVTAYLVKYVI